MTPQGPWYFFNAAAGKKLRRWLLLLGLAIFLRYVYGAFSFHFRHHIGSHSLKYPLLRHAAVLCRLVGPAFIGLAAELHWSPRCHDAWSLSVISFLSLVLALFVLSAFIEMLPFWLQVTEIRLGEGYDSAGRKVISLIPFDHGWFYITAIGLPWLIFLIRRIRAHPEKWLRFEE